MKSLKYKKIVISAACLLFLLNMTFANQVENETEIPSIVKKQKSGKFEIGFHSSLWTLDFIKSLFESAISNELGGEIKNEMYKEIKETHPDLNQSDYEKDLLFDSGGHNFGLELRYYPNGKDGAFSLGLSFDKARMRFSVEGPVRLNYLNGTYATVDSFTEVILNPLFTSLNFRWDMVPHWRVTPFVILGFGIAAMKGEYYYEYAGIYKWAGVDETIEDSKQQTIKEAEENWDLSIPNILPLLQVNIGVRARIIPNLYVKAETGFWNGFILRAGISGRF
jgi:hypothetical protein